ncbi:nucleoside triphosphate pyrophosphohydrolase [Candidatus Babeliales bacterium]|nr:nucleoside triphosphate pyrophosphohydrolase [Candidatus Babeliales bacterium]MBP9843399.1 nucleoside triphosphate pyrophosphohydrolase [Candidatus Babeliales bacterium]
MKKNIKKVVWGLVVILSLYGLNVLYHSNDTIGDDYDRELREPKMRKFLLNKLWRDKAAGKLDKVVIHVQTLGDEEYEKQLNLKLIEEAQEVVDAIANKDELTSEIGDVLEVLECIALQHKIAWKDVLAKKEAKRADRGSYVQRQYVTIAECAPDSFLLSYYLKDPKRHLEIFD